MLVYDSVAVAALVGLIKFHQSQEAVSVRGRILLSEIPEQLFSVVNQTIGPR